MASARDSKHGAGSSPWQRRIELHGSALGLVRKCYGARGWQEAFEGSLWYRLAKLLFDGQPQACATATATARARGGEAGVLEIAASDGRTLVRYLDRETKDLFRERAAPGVDPEEDRGRAGLLHRLARLQESPLERQLRERGARSLRRAWEESPGIGWPTTACSRSAPKGGGFIRASTRAGVSWRCALRGRTARRWSSYSPRRTGPWRSFERWARRGGDQLLLRGS